MFHDKDNNIKDYSEQTKNVTQQHEMLPAGEFSTWLGATRSNQQLKNTGANVPCENCNACCRSSLFIHIKPNEIQTIKHIPKNLLFPAPGLPKGNVLMGYNEKGHCPMFINNKCSIYKYRPQTCRDYDCRIFTATGIILGQKTQALIAKRVKNWKFDYPTDLDHKEHLAVYEAAAFLQEHRDCFPAKTLPSHPSQLAILAIKVYEIFFNLKNLSVEVNQMPTDSIIAKMVMEAMEKFE
jgi:hypothetical protein